MTARVDIIIVNWNAGTQLRDCVDSVIQHGHSVVSKIIVVDNGSTDGSDRFIDGLSNVTFIQTGENLGFGKACNLGAAQANSDFLLFLNPDACVYPNTLPDVLRFMQDTENKNVGICGVQLIDEFGHISRSCARFPSLGIFMSQALGLNRLPRLRHLNTHMFEWAHDQTVAVDHVIGAFFLMRRSLFESLNGFDQRFFVYLEDLDLSLRARQAGWRSVYLTEAQAFHAGAGTSRQVKAHRLFYSLRSRILYAFKHFNPLAASLVLLVTLLVEPLSRSALAVGTRSLTSLKETWSAYALLYRWLPKWLSGKKGTL